MPYQKGILRIEGMLSGMVYYKTQYGYLVRKKTSVNKHRIHHDPAFIRTRENNMEFGNASRAARLLMNAVKCLSADASDNRLISRLTKIMISIKDLDIVNPRGKRTVAIGFTNPAAGEWLRGFDFNINAALRNMLVAPLVLNQSTGSIDISGFIPTNQTVAPKGTTHLSLQAALLRLDFSDNNAELQLSPVENLPFDTSSHDITLKPAIAPTDGGTRFYLLKVSYLQLINGEQYHLINSNSMSIIEVA